MDETNHRARWARLVAVAAALGLVLALGACSGDDDDDDAGAPSGEGSSSGDATLDIESNSFTDISAPAGGTIEVVNSSGVGHTFTADDGAFDEAVGDGDTVDVTTPDEAGEYPFHCEIHPSMQATLTVQ